MKLLLLMLVSCFLQLQLCAQSSNFAYTTSVQPVMQLTLSTSSSNLVFSTPEQYAGEYTITNFNTVTIKTNQLWNLSLASTSSTFTASGTFSSANMPASICKIGVTGQASTLLLSTSSQLLSSGNRGDETYPGNTFDMTLKINPGYNYGAGIYNIGLVYTLSAQ